MSNTKTPTFTYTLIYRGHPQPIVLNVSMEESWKISNAALKNKDAGPATLYSGKDINGKDFWISINDIIYAEISIHTPPKAHPKK